VVPIDSLYDLLLGFYCNFRRITHRFRGTSCFNAETHIFFTPLVFYLEFEGHADAVGMWRQNLAAKSKLESWGCHSHTVKKS